MALPASRPAQGVQPDGAESETSGWDGRSGPSGRGDSERLPPGGYGLDEHVRDGDPDPRLPGTERAASWSPLHWVPSSPSTPSSRIPTASRARPARRRLARVEEPAGGAAAIEEGLDGPQTPRHGLRNPEAYLDFWSLARTSPSKICHRDSPTTISNDLQEVEGGLTQASREAAEKTRLLSPPRARGRGGAGRRRMSEPSSVRRKASSPKRAPYLRRNP